MKKCSMIAYVSNTANSANTTSTLKGVLIRIISAGAGILLLCFVISLMFITLFEASGPIIGYSLLLMWITLPMLWLIGSGLAIKRTLKESFSLQDDALVLHKSGLLSTSNKTYRYDSILSAELTQGLLGKRFNYGDIYLTIPRMEHRIRLKDVPSPQEVISKIKKKSVQSVGESFIH